MFSPNQVLNMAINLVNNPERVKHIDFVNIIHYLSLTNASQEERIKKLEQDIKKQEKEIKWLDGSVVRVERKVGLK